MNKFTLHDILTFPNLLSFLRIPMAFLFYYFYNWGNGTGVILAAVTLLVSALTIAYGTEVKGAKRGNAMLLQNGKFLLFSLILTLLTQWVFQGFLSVKLPGFSLF